MDFSGVTNDASSHTLQAVQRIFAMKLSPDDTVASLTRLFETVGTSFHSQLYGATSYVLGGDAMATAGLNDSSGQASRLALKLTRDAALSRSNSADFINSFFHSALAQAQQEAFDNSRSMQKHPTLTRSIVGETCKWCNRMAGIYTDPPHDAFKRHGGCDCKLKVSGYRTRNGSVQNYVKARR